MKIYLTHGTAFDYQKELYQPLEALQLQDVEFIFSHQSSQQGEYSRDIINNVDAILAEVSYPSTGMGIELGWANAAGTPIIAIHRAEQTISSSLRLICQSVHPYRSFADIEPII